MYKKIRIWLTWEDEKENNLKNQNSLLFNYLVECKITSLEIA